MHITRDILLIYAWINIHPLRFFTLPTTERIVIYGIKLAHFWSGSLLYQTMIFLNIHTYTGNHRTISSLAVLPMVLRHFYQMHFIWNNKSLTNLCEFCSIFAVVAYATTISEHHKPETPLIQRKSDFFFLWRGKLRFEYASINSQSQILVVIFFFLAFWCFT